MMTFNEQRNGQKEFDAPRFYGAPMLQQQYVLISSQMHPQSTPHQNSYLNPDYQHYPTSNMHQGLLLSYQPNAFSSQSQPLVQNQYLGTVGYDQVFDQNACYVAAPNPPPQASHLISAYGPQQMHSVSPNQRSSLNHMVALNQVAPMQTGMLPMTTSQQQATRNSSYHQAFIERLQELLPTPPLLRAPTRPDMTLSHTHRRTKRKSKFTKHQDEMIVRLKKEGRPWVEIAEVVGVGSYLAARNRYQVIVGQQGNNNSLSWTSEDRDELQKLLDSAEMDKWRYISQELSKATGKAYGADECREYARMMFWQNPAAFGVNEETIIELQKEKRATERLLQQDFDNMKRYNHSPELAI